MTGQWRNHAMQFGSRAIDQRHRDQREFFKIVLCEGDEEIVRQRRQRMGKTFPGMTRLGKFKLVKQPGELGTQDRDIFRSGSERGAGPHAGNNR